MMIMAHTKEERVGEREMEMLKGDPGDHPLLYYHAALGALLQT